VSQDVHTRSKRLKLILLTTIATIFLLTTFSCKRDNATTAANNNTGEIAARIGNVAIPLSKVDRIIEQGLQSQTRKKLSDLSPVELAAARLQALDTLITEEVLYQRATQENIKISDEEVRNQIQKGIQSGGLSEDDFQKQLKTIGITETEFQEEQRRKLVIDKLQDKMSTVKTPTDREITEYYNNNPAQFQVGRGIYLSAIIVDPADNKAKNDAIGNEQAKQKIDSIYAQLKGGGDFATVARIQSEHISAEKSGDLGFLDEQALQQYGFPPQLIQTFFSMREGDITPPVEGSGRWYIFKLTAKRTQEEKLTLDSPQVKAQISQLLMSQRKEILNSALVSNSLTQARVENFLAKRILDNPDNFGSLRPTSLSISGEQKEEKKEEKPGENPPPSTKEAAKEGDKKSAESPK
jgi:parvulin-like peptidyl-prolyl isomerase